MAIISATVGSGIANEIVVVALLHANLKVLTNMIDIVQWTICIVSLLYDGLSLFRYRNVEERKSTFLFLG